MPSKMEFRKDVWVMCSTNHANVSQKLVFISAFSVLLMLWAWEPSSFTRAEQVLCHSSHLRFDRMCWNDGQFVACNTSENQFWQLAAQTNCESRFWMWSEWLIETFPTEQTAVYTSACVTFWLCCCWITPISQNITQCIRTSLYNLYAFFFTAQKRTLCWPRNKVYIKKFDNTVLTQDPLASICLSCQSYHMICISRLSIIGCHGNGCVDEQACMCQPSWWTSCDMTDLTFQTWILPFHVSSGR